MNEYIYEVYTELLKDDYYTTVYGDIIIDAIKEAMNNISKPYTLQKINKYIKENLI